MKTRSSQGNVLLATLLFLTVFAIVAASMIDLSLNTHRLSKRNEYRARAQAVAESEIEYLYFEFRSECLLGTYASDVPDSTRIANIADKGDEPSTTRTPFLVSHQNEGWRVRRALEVDRQTIQGSVPGTTKTGQYTYINARVEVLPPENSPYGEVINVRIGRRFINATSTVFQYSIFYQGDLEMTPGTDTTITGDVAVNGNVYLASANASTLTINNKIKYLQGGRFNETANGLLALNNPNAPARHDVLTAPVFATSQASQVSTYEEAENFLGGLELEDTTTSRTDLFGTDPDEALNNAYRSVIAPPPSASTIDEYPSIPASDLAGFQDDPAINASRAYTRAGIVITVNSDGSLRIVNQATGADITANLAPAIDTTKTLHDLREGNDVAVREIDVGALGPLIASSAPDFNGMLYINLKGASATRPAAVRLVNAEQVPNISGTGFSVATNGGMYVKGDYNTKTGPSTSGKVSAMLMADALTVLSNDWDDTNATLPVGSRAVTDQTTLTVNAGLLTGTATSTPTSYSGGANNIVRYLEDWRGSTVNLHGAIGRLFKSTIMTGGFQQPGVVYFPPSRNFSFDTELAASPPPGGINTTSNSRGNFFTW